MQTTRSSRRNTDAERCFCSSCRSRTCTALKKKTIFSSTGNERPSPVHQVIILLSLFVKTRAVIYDDRCNYWIPLNRLITGSDHHAKLMSPDSHTPVRSVTTRRDDVLETTASVDRTKATTTTAAGDWGRAATDLTRQFRRRSSPTDEDKVGRVDRRRECKRQSGR